MGLLRAVLRHGFRGGCGGQAAEGAACRWPAPQPAKQEGDEEVRVARLQPWAALLSRTAPPLRSRRSGIEFHQSKSKNYYVIHVCFTKTVHIPMWIFKMNFVHRGAATAAARRAARRNRSELTDTASRGWSSKLSMYTSLRSHLYAFI